MSATLSAPATASLPSALTPVKPRVLAICNIDLMAAILLKPWFSALASAGYEVHIACSAGAYLKELEADGFTVHPIPVRRRLNPLANLDAIWQVYRVVRRGRFDVVNAHSPIGAAVGRIACKLARVKNVVYTVHGFYFHDQMPTAKRWAFMGVEWLLARLTKRFMFVSDEDRRTALRTGIVRRPEDAVTILNGVNLNRFHPARDRSAERAHRGLPPLRRVVGITGRIVREKGYREYLAMAVALQAGGEDLTYLVLGDSLASDRDQFASRFRQAVGEAGLSSNFVFTGFTENVPEYLRAMDIFVLPSYREGFPRSVLEAMATGLPVVATNIRGCREAVVHGETGWIVPPRDAEALTAAVRHLLCHEPLARSMGDRGLRRAQEMFNEHQVRARFVGVIDEMTHRVSAVREAQTR